MAVHLFRPGLIGGEPIFVSSEKLAALPIELKHWITDELGAVEHRSGGIQVAIVTESNPRPMLKGFDEVFTQSFLRDCPRILIVLASAAYPNGKF